MVFSLHAHPGTMTILASSCSGGTVAGQWTVDEEYLRLARSDRASTARIWTLCGPRAAPARSTASGSAEE